jgi:hypothetical protein
MTSDNVFSDWLTSLVAFFDKTLYYIWCGFRTILLAKSVTWYTEYLMHFFHCEETRRYVSIFKYIDAMLLNLDPDIVRSGPRLHSTCSKQHGGSASSSADEKKIC